MTPTAKLRRDFQHQLQRQRKLLIELGLEMGQPNHCFANATACVWLRPDRLKYVEGFVIHRCGCCQDMNFIHHAWVVDKLTGTRLEITITNPVFDAVYLGREFTRDELTAFDEPMERSEDWESQLTLQMQFDMLVGAGHDVELCTY